VSATIAFAQSGPNERASTVSPAVTSEVEAPLKEMGWAWTSPQPSAATGAGRAQALTAKTTVTKAKEKSRITGRL
jgi:hypothetical protein